MRYAAGHREQTRAKILRAAGKVFRRQGYHAAGVDKVMEEAGLTAGGFYAHFGSKECFWPRRWRPRRPVLCATSLSSILRAARGPRLSWSAT